MKGSHAIISENWPTGSERAQSRADQIQVRNVQPRDARHEAISTQRTRGSRGHQLPQRRTKGTVQQLDFFIERHLLHQQVGALVGR